MASKRFGKWAIAVGALAPLDAAAQEDAYLSCSERTACYTSNGCRSDSAEAIFLTLYDGGDRAVVEGIGQTQTLKSIARNVYHVPITDGFWVIVLSDDWSAYAMTQAFPDIGDAVAISGTCERRNY